jgi:hypothetical protein
MLIFSVIVKVFYEIRKVLGYFNAYIIANLNAILII